MTPEDERAAIVAWLRAEANGCRASASKNPESFLSVNVAMRALFYEQAAGFIERAEHHRQDGGDDGQG